MSNNYYNSKGIVFEVPGTLVLGVNTRSEKTRYETSFFGLRRSGVENFNACGDWRLRLNFPGPLSGQDWSLVSFSPRRRLTKRHEMTGWLKRRRIVCCMNGSRNDAIGASTRCNVRQFLGTKQRCWHRDLRLWAPSRLPRRRENFRNVPWLICERCNTTTTTTVRRAT